MRLAAAVRGLPPLEGGRRGEPLSPLLPLHCSVVAAVESAPLAGRLSWYLRRSNSHCGDACAPSFGTLAEGRA